MRRFGVERLRNEKTSPIALHESGSTCHVEDERTSRAFVDETSRNSVTNLCLFPLFFLALCHTNNWWDCWMCQRKWWWRYSCRIGGAAAVAPVLCRFLPIAGGTDTFSTHALVDTDLPGVARLPLAIQPKPFSGGGKTHTRGIHHGAHCRYIP